MSLARKRKLGLSHLGAVLSLLQLLLGLPELGQVESSDFLCLFDLLLVCLDLLLELLGQVSHLFLVLVVFLLLELKLLDTALSLLVGLSCLRSSALHTSKFNLHLPDARLKLGHGVAASLHGIVISLGQTVFQLGDLCFHCLLSLLLRVLGLMKHVINFSMHGMAGRFQMPLFSKSLGVDGSHVIDSCSGISQFHVTLLLASVSRVQESPGLLQFSLKSISLAVGKSSFLSNFHPLAALLFQCSFNIP